MTHRIVGYLRRRLTGEVIDFVELEMPPHSLETTAVMYTITPEALHGNGIDPLRIPGSLHAAEHAAIGLLPLVASCDRGDIGGLSTAIGPESGVCQPSSSMTVIRAERASPSGVSAGQAPGWVPPPPLSRRVSAPQGCPSCVQSPKCGNGNDPLDKAGAVRVLMWCWPR